MKTIFVNKASMSFVTREEAARGSATGEQGDTEGWLRHIMRRGDFKVIYVGKTRGDMIGSGLCHEVYTTETRGISVYDGKEQQAQFDKDARELKHYEPVAMLQTAGPCYTMSWINNPKYTTVQEQSIHYGAPALNIMQQLRLPRVVINNDPRTYPRDQEMSLGWPFCRPAALLDQCQASGPMVVGGKQYTRKSVYAHCESWLYCPQRTNTRQFPLVVVAHCHVGDGCKQKGRDQTWQRILGDKSIWPEHLAVFGQGWEHYSQYDPAFMKGKVNPQQALDLFNDSLCTPCIAAVPGFATGKGYVAISQGCIPLPVGDDEYAWDWSGVACPLDSAYRIRKPGDFYRLADWIERDYAMHLETWQEALKPRFQVLDNLLDDLQAGRRIDDGRYGGYL